MSMLKGFSDEQLKNELERRERKLKVREPKPFCECSFLELYKMTILHVANRVRHGADFDSDTLDEFAVEELVSAVYGGGIWDELNAVQADGT